MTALALAAGAVASAFASRMEQVRADWGPTLPVVVATEAVPAGGTLDSATTRVEARPRAVVPVGALPELQPGARAAHPLTAGEVVTELRLAGAELSAVAARLPEGTRAVAVPNEVGITPPLTVADRVDVIVALAPDLAGDGPPGFVLVHDAVVVDVSESAITVAVGPDDAPRVAVALGSGAVTLALVGR